MLTKYGREAEIDDDVALEKNVLWRTVTHQHVGRQIATLQAAREPECERILPRKVPVRVCGGEGWGVRRTPGTSTLSNAGAVVRTGDTRRGPRRRTERLDHSFYTSDQ